MKTIYRAAFNLTQVSTHDELMDEVSRLCWNWVFSPKRRATLGEPAVPPPTSAGTTPEQEVFSDWKVQTHRIDSGDTCAYGFRLRHPDFEDVDLEWVTDVTLVSSGGSPPKFTCSLSVVDHGNLIRPIRRRPSRPGIVADVLGQIGGKSIFPLLTKPLDLSESENDCSTLMNALLSKSRRHPLVLITVRNDDHNALVSPRKVASHLAGLAHVVLARNSQVTWNLCSLIPSYLNCYNGAVRLYWPGLKLTDSPYQHPLWAPQVIARFGDVQSATNEISSQILEAISSIASFKMPEHHFTWDQVLELGRRKAIAEAKELALAQVEVSGKANAWAEMLEKENFLQSERIRNLEDALGEQAAESERQRSIAENYRIALQFAHSGEINSDEPSVTQSLPPESVNEAIVNAERDHSEKLAFSFNSKSEDKTSLFLAPDEVERAFNWLATTYWNARTGKQPCTDLDKSVRETIPGWSLSGGQKKHSVGKHEAWYQCKWNGSDYWIGEHLGCGVSKRPEETIRIAFAWDDEHKKVVIGYLGQHQRNSNS